MTRQGFEVQMHRLASLRFAPESLDEHFKQLADIPDDIFEAAIGHSAKTRAIFPTIAELRADADAVAPPASAGPELPRVVDLEDARVVEVPNPLGGNGLMLTVTKDWYTDCDVCNDSGWAERWCGEGLPYPWLQSRACGQRSAHTGHSWVERCVCIDTNPTIKRRKEAARVKYSKVPERVGV